MAVLRHLDLRDSTISRHELHDAQGDQHRHLALGLRHGGHTFGRGPRDPSAPRKPNNQGHNGADGYSSQQTSAGLSLQD